MSKRHLRPLYPHDGFALRPVKTLADGEELLHCSERKTSIRCGAMGKRTINGRIYLQKPHSGHVADDSKAKLAKVEIKDLAQTSGLTPRDIIHETRSKYGSQAVVMAGSVSTIGRLINRQRTEKCLDSEAADATVPVFQGKMTKDNDNEQFLLFDSICANTGGRHVAFASNLQLETLEKSKLLLTDGTFAVAQPPFQQLWCIHAQFEQSIFPMVHVLMSSRSVEDYEFVIDSLKTLIPAWAPSDYLGDKSSY